jgi:hypothetical protein
MPPAGASDDLVAEPRRTRRCRQGRTACEAELFALRLWPRELVERGRRDDYEMRCASCVRDFTSSFRKALRRWYSTVLWVMKS